MNSNLLLDVALERLRPEHEKCEHVALERLRPEPEQMRAFALTNERPRGLWA